MNIEIDLDKNMEILNSRLGESFDIVIREITDFRGVRAAVVFSDGLVDKELIAGEIIRPLLGYAMDSKEAPRKDGTGPDAADYQHRGRGGGTGHGQGAYGGSVGRYGDFFRRRGQLFYGADEKVAVPQHQYAGYPAVCAGTEGGIYGNPPV